MIGGVIAAWTTYASFRLQSNYSWRIPSIIQGAIPFLKLLGIWVIPQSPRYETHTSLPAFHLMIHSNLDGSLPRAEMGKLAKF
jgi:hypothetical protein